MFKHSIILTSFNRPVFVRHAIRSVLSQSRTGFELFVADDGSTEETVLAIKGAVENDERCTLVSFAPPARGEPRRGVPRMVSNINYCLERITGDIVHYLADDDFYDERRLERFDALFQDERVTVGYGMLAYVDRAGCLTGEIRYPDRIEDPYRVLDHNQVVHQRSVLNECGLWPIIGEQNDQFAPDGHFFRKLKEHHEFCGTRYRVAYKRDHEYSMILSRDQSGVRRE
jgi:spore maturation protein CgeD